jgi:hypothetical protein
MTTTEQGEYQQAEIKFFDWRRRRYGHAILLKTGRRAYVSLEVMRAAGFRTLAQGTRVEVMMDPTRPSTVERLRVPEQARG